MTDQLPSLRFALPLSLCALALAGSGCLSAERYHRSADRVAARAIEQKQLETLGRSEPFTIETSDDPIRRRVMLGQHLPHAVDASLSSRDLAPIEGWPEEERLKEATTRPATTQPIAQPLRITLIDALQIGASSNRDYQARKESIFLDALALDLERNDFRTIFAGTIDGRVITDHTGGGKPDTGLTGVGALSLSQRFRNGAVFASRFSFDVVKLLTGSRSSSNGIAYDGSLTVPLLRGAGRHVVAEPLTQAERNLAYDLLEFEQYRRQFAVNIASQYLSVLQQYDQIRNAEAAYQRALLSTRRARRLADAGRLPEIQVDQSVQQELRSRERWVSAIAGLGRRLDSFKILLGLPPDAEIELDPTELQKLSALAQNLLDKPTQEAVATMPTTGPIPEALTESDEPLTSALDTARLPMGFNAEEAIQLALEHRPDLHVSIGEIFDAQRKVRVAANALEAGLDLIATASAGGRRGSLGSADSPNAQLRFEEGVYSAGAVLDLPLERTAERNAYRASLINVESAVRRLHGFEDQIKLDIRSGVRDVMLAREQIQIQYRSVAVAQKRVDSTNLFLEAGRAAIRDVLEAQDALVSAQNALTSAIVNYRVAELGLQRDMGLLEVDSSGNWREIGPGQESEP